MSQTATAERHTIEFADPEPAPRREVATIERLAAPAEAQLQAATGFMALIEKAVVAGNIDLVDKMMVLQDRWEANEARKAFNNALAAAKSEIKPIIKNRTVGFEAKNGGSDVSYQHEDIAGIADQIDGILAKHGLWYRWRPVNDFATGMVSVTCIVSHKLGHAEETTLSGKIDVSGAKNHLQAVGSAVTYLERYTLKAALGLASKHDDDGRASGPPLAAGGAEPETGEVVSAAQAETIKQKIVHHGVPIAAFLAWVRKKVPDAQTVEDIPAQFYRSAIVAIESYQGKKV